MVILHPSKRLGNKKYASESAASEFLSTVSDDLLLEILIRLPRLGPAITVCKNWHSLIISDHPNTFHRHILHHHRRQQNNNPDPSYNLPYTLLLGFRRNKPYVQELSNKSKILRSILSKQLPNETFLGFVSNLDSDAIKASFNGSLLIRLNGQYYICNPITREQRLLPDPPPIVHDYYHAKFMLVGSEEPNGFRFRVLIFRFGRSEFSKQILVFSSETGQWNESVLKNYPMSSSDHMAATNGALMWPQEPEGVCVYDPFRPADDPNSCRIVNFPAGFADRYSKTLLVGAVRGRFRLSQMLFVQKFSSYHLRIWELNYCNSDEWSLVHEVDLKSKVKGETMKVVAFHPREGDVIFVSRSLVIYRCDLKDGEGKRRIKFCQVPREGFPLNLSPADLYFLNFTFLFHPWPSQIFSKKNIFS